MKQTKTKENKEYRNTKVFVIGVMILALLTCALFIVGNFVEKREMESCIGTRTEKGYCALECYENDRLIPCENFTYDEHFCNEGICKASGGCPDYFEKLEGKTIGDCIKEVEEYVEWTEWNLTEYMTERWGSVETVNYTGEKENE